jgi:riboflavin synthase
VFTGLVQAVGSARLDRNRLVVNHEEGEWSHDLRIGESVAVNGCCLTVVSIGDGELGFDLSPETLTRTTFGRSAGDFGVNLERALRATDRLGGHFVLGHVDGVGTLLSISPQGEGALMRFQGPEGAERYLIDKGCIAIDGVSLTVVNPVGAEFDVAVIPHTLATTNLRGLSPSMRAHMEFDVLAKHVEKLLATKG